MVVRVVYSIVVFPLKFASLVFHSVIILMCYLFITLIILLYSVGDLLILCFIS